jgi:Cu/Ag efflux protein CusF
MKSKGLFYGTLFIVFSGCTAYELQPVNTNHPASLEAMAAPRDPVSKTLAYSRADIPAVTVAAAPKAGHENHHMAAQANDQKTVIGEGKVIATVPNANQLVVEHGEIKGFMESMTMGYLVEPVSLLDGLKSGDQVRFTIDVPKKTIVKIEKLK